MQLVCSLIKVKTFALEFARIYYIVREFVTVYLDVRFRAQHQSSGLFVKCVKLLTEKLAA